MIVSQYVCIDDCKKTWRLSRHENGVITLEAMPSARFSGNNNQVLANPVPCYKLPIEFASRVPCEKTQRRLQNNIFIQKPVLTIDPGALSWTKYFVFGGVALGVLFVVSKVWKN